MRINKALVDRALNAPSVSDNTLMIFRRLVSLTEEYNRIAKDKGLPIKKAPVYDDSLNCALLLRLTRNLLRDIDRIRNITVRRDILTGVKFVDNKFNDGIWTYRFVPESSITTVSLNPEAFSAEFGEAADVRLDYEYMPYERLIDTEGVEYPVSSYIGLFARQEGGSLLPSTVKRLTIDNWTNTEVTSMLVMFMYSTLESLILGDGFNTSNVTDMEAMFDQCSSLKSLMLGDGFNTSKVEKMGGMFSRCVSLESLWVGANFNTTNVTEMNDLFFNDSKLASLTLYRSAESIIRQLPGGTWKFDGFDGTVTVVQGDTATYEPSTLYDEWGDDRRTLRLQSS